MKGLRKKTKTNKKPKQRSIYNWLIENNNLANIYYLYVQSAILTSVSVYAHIWYTMYAQKKYWNLSSICPDKNEQWMNH